MRPYRFEQPVDAPERLDHRQSGDRLSWACRGTAVLAGSAGVLNLAFPLEKGTGGSALDLLTVVFGFWLIVVALDLWWRRQWAGQVSVGLLAAAACCHLVEGRGITEGSVSILVAAFLLVMTPLFRRRSRPLALGHAVQRAVLAWCLVLGWGVAGFRLMNPTQFGTAIPMWRAAELTLRMMTFSPVLGIVPCTRYAGWFLVTLCALEVAGITYGALVLGPALRLELDWSADAGEAVWRTEAARMFYSPSRRSYLRYGVQGQFAVVLGLPGGAADESELVVDLFARYCRRNGWGLGYQYDNATGQPVDADHCHGAAKTAPPMLREGSRSVA